MIGLNLYKIKLLINFNYLKIKLVKKKEKKKKYLLKNNGKKIVKKKEAELLSS